MLKTLFSQIIEKRPDFSLLNELHTEDMDANQVWAQLEFINSNYLKNAVPLESADSVKNMDIDEESRESNSADGSTFGGFDDVFHGIDENLHDSLPETNDIQHESSEDENFEFEDEIAKEALENSDNFEDTDGSIQGEGETEQLPKNAKTKTKKSIVDDQFFSLEEMNWFADQSEAHDLKIAKQSGGQSEIEIEEEDDMFAAENDMYDELDDDDNANDIKYSDFFEKPEAKEVVNDPLSEADSEDELIQELEQDFEDNYDEQMQANEEINFTGEAQDLFGHDDDESINQQFSTFEKQQFKTQKEIKEFEKELIAEKEWALKGEINAAKRPKDSLLQENLDVDIASRPVPEITEETTQNIEDLVIQRIKDQAFDDVERKEVVENNFNVNRRWELDDQKSKKSLAEQYEGEKEAQTEAEKKLAVQHQEIDSLIKVAFSQLDALANWHYTPSPATLEVVVVPNVSTISMEEKIPLAVSTAQTLAPSEIYKGTVAKSAAELDSSEKAKLRKAAKKQHGMIKKKKAAKTKDNNSKGDAVKHLMKQKNVTMVIGPNDCKKVEGNAKQIKVGGSTEPKRESQNIASLRL